MFQAHAGPKRPFDGGSILITEPTTHHEPSRSRRAFSVDEDCFYQEEIMNRRTALSIAAGMSLVTTAPAPASTKPCRNKDGQIIQCPKPPRKLSPRCKDAQGRFTACQAPANGAEKRDPTRLSK